MSYLLRPLVAHPINIIARNYHKIVITDDGSTIVALHREVEFPYEFSKPLPEEVQHDKSVLRMNDYDEVRRVFKDLKPEIVRQQLASLTLTTTHRWFPRARDKKAKKTEMNRTYL
ncbi:jg21493 [Pararge aegeria aegeria]|uniref:Large ribosomal subunit protein mL42 n=1 Tax=Pararge aegeria aegeria TaxID=348720 RepID=A0A8S4RN39_9NEOP|nr:jg21493 [Pararge aegeria aegeria]